MVTFSTWVSPRWNRPEPWARGRMPTSASSGRMSRGPRPSIRLASLTTRWRTSSLVRLRKVARDLLLATGQGLAEAARSLPGRPRPWLVEPGLALGLVGDGDGLAHLALDRAPGRPRPRPRPYSANSGYSSGWAPSLADQLDLELAGGGDAGSWPARGPAAEDLLGRLEGAALLHQPDGLLGRLGLDHEDIDPAGPFWRPATTMSKVHSSISS